MAQKQNYSLTPINGKERFIIFLQADANDADYIGEKTVLTVTEFESIALEQLRILKTFYSGNGEFESFRSGVITLPYGEHDNCHTLTELQVIFIDNRGKSYIVKIDKFSKEEIDNIKNQYGDDYDQYQQDLEQEYYKQFL